MEISNECISSCLSGERVAQRKLYDILLPYLTTVCSRYLNDRSFINDVLQEAFIDLFKNLASYDIAKASIKTWAVKLAINQCMKANRKTERVDFSDAIIAQMPAILNSEILGRLEDEELLKFLKSMPADYYQVFNRHVIDGFSHQEISKELDISEELSRKRLSRARKWLDEHTDSQKREVIWTDAKRTRT